MAKKDEKLEKPASPDSAQFHSRFVKRDAEKEHINAREKNLPLNHK